MKWLMAARLVSTLRAQAIARVLRQRSAASLTQSQVFVISSGRIEQRGYVTLFK